MKIVLFLCCVAMAECLTSEDFFCRIKSEHPKTPKIGHNKEHKMTFLSRSSKRSLAKLMSTMQEARRPHFISIRNSSSIRFIHSNAFSSLSILIHLDMAENKINRIAGNAFGGLQSLRFLCLKTNLIADVPDNTFADLHVLEYLCLSENQLTSLHRSTWSGLKYLLILDVSLNSIHKIAKGTFKELVQLKILDLSHNKLHFLQHGHFEGLVHLTALQIQTNEITSIESETFADTPLLSRLCLEQNKLHTLNANMLQGLGNLKVLTLHHNNISGIQMGTFRQSKLIWHLNLMGNNLTEVDENTFMGLKHLKSLWLQDNQIAKIETGAFAFLSYREKDKIQLYVSRINLSTASRNILNEAITLMSEAESEHFSANLLLGGNVLSYDEILCEVMKVVGQDWIYWWSGNPLKESPHSLILTNGRKSNTNSSWKKILSTNNVCFTKCPGLSPEKNKHPTWSHTDFCHATDKSGK